MKAWLIRSAVRLLRPVYEQMMADIRIERSAWSGSPEGREQMMTTARAVRDALQEINARSVAPAADSVQQ